MSANPASPLAHHFEDLRQQHDANTLGMWVFLGTELMFFGGIFTAYTVYRSMYPEAFAAGSHHLNVWIGGFNTLVLLTSSLTMALAVHAAQTAHRQALVNLLVATALLGATFLGVKAYEYYVDYEEALIPVFRFDATKFGDPPGQTADAHVDRTTDRLITRGGNPQPRDRRQPSPPMTVSHARNVELFLVFYYVMTLIHAVHLIIGIGMLIILAVRAHQGRYTPAYYAPIEVGGLYWHFVDVVWIFLLPLLYLVGGASH